MLWNGSLRGVKVTSERRPRSAWQEAMNAGSVGLEMAVAVAIGFFGGKWLDGEFGTSPVLQWIGLGLGVAAAGLAIVRVSRRYLKDDDRDGEKRGRDGSDGPV